MEDLTQDSTWLCSRSIREITYKILSSSIHKPICTVEEWDRARIPEKDCVRVDDENILFFKTMLKVLVVVVRVHSLHVGCLPL